MNNEFPQTERNKVRRVPNRGIYDRDSVYRIIDQAWICHVGFISEIDGWRSPTIIPMFHARLENQIIFHGATTSRLMQSLGSGEPVCVSAAMVDGIVLAKSLFHHSMNYRSVVMFGSGREIDDPQQRLTALQALSDKVMPGRWEDSRGPNEQELKATSVVAVEIESASAKIRTGGPKDDPDDQGLPFWSGVVPFREMAESAVTDNETSQELKVPGYIRSFIESHNQ